MHRIFIGLSPFLAIFAVYIAFPVVTSHLIQQEYLRQDQLNLPYLKDVNYFRPEGCAENWDGKSEISNECAPHRYWIKSDAMARQFKLPSHGRKTDGWFRIGRDAFDLKCWNKSCAVSNVVSNVFGS